jgi:hypothetical protein
MPIDFSDLSSQPINEPTERAEKTTSAEEENWRDVPGYEGAYQVSDLGRVRSLTRNIQVSRYGKLYVVTRRGRVLSPRTHPSGHLTVELGKRGGTQCIHALVLKAFVGPRPAGEETRHLDGNAQNNRLDNLEYSTPSRNQQDKKWHKGAANYVLRPAEVLDIKQRLKAGGQTQRELAKEFGVSDCTISAIKIGRVHRDVLCVDLQEDSSS